MKRTRKLLAVCALALAAPVAAGCGGDDEDPADLIRDAFGQETNYDSGVLNIGLDGSVEGVVNGAIDAEISGPFTSGGEGEVPELALDATANISAEGIPQLPGGSLAFEFSGGFGLTGETMFVTYQDTTYEASRELFAEIRPLLETVQSAGETTQDPEGADAFIDALTNLENEGTEDIEGESAVHVSGDLDLAALTEEGAAVSGVPFDPASLEGFSSTVDLYVAEEDNTFRRIDLGFAADQVEALAASGIEGLGFTISVGISEPNSEQTIEAPTDTQPLDDLLQQLGTSEAQIAQALQGGLVPIAPGGAGGGVGDVVDPNVQECLREVDPTDTDAIAACLN